MSLQDKVEEYITRVSLEPSCSFKAQYSALRFAFGPLESLADSMLSYYEELVPIQTEETPEGVGELNALLFSLIDEPLEERIKLTLKLFDATQGLANQYASAAKGTTSLQREVLNGLAQIFPTNPPNVDTFTGAIQLLERPRIALLVGAYLSSEETQNAQKKFQALYEVPLNGNHGTNYYKISELLHQGIEEHLTNFCMELNSTHFSREELSNKIQRFKKFFTQKLEDSAEILKEAREHLPKYDPKIVGYLLSGNVSIDDLCIHPSGPVKGMERFSEFGKYSKTELFGIIFRNWGFLEVLAGFSQEFEALEKPNQALKYLHYISKAPDRLSFLESLNSAEGWFAELSILEVIEKYGFIIPSVAKEVNDKGNFVENKINMSKARMMWEHQEIAEIDFPLQIMYKLQNTRDKTLSKKEKSDLNKLAKLAKIQPWHTIEETISNAIYTHAIQDFVGDESMYGFWVDLLSPILSKDFFHEQFDQIYGPFPKDEISRIEEIVRSSKSKMRFSPIEVDSTNPTFICERRFGHIEIKAFLKLYDTQYEGLEQFSFFKERSNAQYFAPILMEMLGIAIPQPLVSSSSVVQSRNGSEYQAITWKYIEGDCASRRLSGWKGKRRAQISQKRLTSFLVNAIDQLAIIHHTGNDVPEARDVTQERDYFTKRIQTVLLDSFVKNLGFPIPPEERASIVNAYQGINDTLLWLTATYGAYYKDASPRNFIIGQNLTPIDFEGRKMLFSGIDIVSLLESGWDYPNDQVVLTERKDYASKTQKENAIARYLLYRTKLEQKDLAQVKIIDEILLEKDLTMPQVYSSDPRYSEFVQPDQYALQTSAITGFMRVHRHLEYVGHCLARLNRTNKPREIQVHVRNAVYHANEAKEALSHLGDCLPFLSEELQRINTNQVASTLGDFLDKYCNFRVIREHGFQLA